MPKFQVLTGVVNLGGDRDQQAVRGADNPITFPEAMVLRHVHGGVDHVHSLVSINGHPLGEERSDAEERDRLISLYGAKSVAELFPGGLPLPQADASIITAEEAEEVRAATERVLAQRSSKKAKDAKPAPAVEAPVLPEVSALPTAG